MSMEFTDDLDMDDTFTNSVEFCVSLLGGELTFVMRSEQADNVILIDGIGNEYSIPVNAFTRAAMAIQSFADGNRW